MTEMEHKGWLTESGRVVRKVTSALDPFARREGVRYSVGPEREEIIGEIGLISTHYNLARPCTVHTWVVRIFEGDSFRGPTRADAIEQAIRRS